MRRMRNSGAVQSLSLALLALAGAARAESISGVCPDGSIYIVQHARQIPCSRSKQVEPGEVPPVRPDYLPKPHTWEVWAEQNDPNNPYNVVDQARQVRALSASGAVGAPAPAPGGEAAGAAAGVAAAPPAAAPSAATPREQGPLALGLAEQDFADLFAIVDLSQSRTPARFERETASGQGVARVAFARSRAFEQRLLDAQRARGAAGAGSVLLFTARSSRPQEFWPNFVFVQDSLTFQPDAANDRQLGVLQGRLGQLGEGEVVLGYVVLPEAMSLEGRALEIYWDDRHTTARF
jgi:hypothetical protein